MSGSAFAVTHHAFSSGAGRTSDGNGSHASTLKSPSYTKSVSWQHYQDLRFVHQLDNNASVMRYWFEEPYEAFVELSDLYDKHIHDQSERRFVISFNGNNAGLVELVEINHIHRRAEFQIIISPEYQGKGLATRAAKLAMDYGFTVLNLYKLYLIVDKENAKAIHIYRKLGFIQEGELIHEFFVNGEYRNTIRMCIFQHQYLENNKSTGGILKPTAQ